MRFVETGALFCSLILIVTLFTPYSYAFNQNEQQELTFTNKTENNDCPGIETEMMDGEEFSAMLNASEDFMVQRFGQKADDWDKIDMMEANDIPDDPSTEQGKEQFFMTSDMTPVRLFDVQKRSSGSKAESCYMSNVMVNGFMSYALRVGANIRYCNGYPAGPECGKGITPEDKAKPGEASLGREYVNVMEEVGEELAKNASEVNIEVIDSKLRNLESRSISILEESDKDSNINLELTSTEKTQIETHLKQNNVEAAEDIIFEKINKAVGKMQEDLGIETQPYNTIESPETFSYLTQADTAFIFPRTLTNYFKVFEPILEEVEYWNQMALIVTIGSAVVSMGAGGVGKGATEGTEGLSRNAKHADKYHRQAAKATAKTLDDKIDDALDISTGTGKADYIDWVNPKTGDIEKINLEDATKIRDSARNIANAVPDKGKGLAKLKNLRSGGTVDVSDKLDEVFKVGGKDVGFGDISSVADNFGSKQTQSLWNKAMHSTKGADPDDVRAWTQTVLNTQNADPDLLAYAGRLDDYLGGLSPKNMDALGNRPMSFRRTLQKLTVRSGTDTKLSTILQGVEESAGGLGKWDGSIMRLASRPGHKFTKSLAGFGTRAIRLKKILGYTYLAARGFRIGATADRAIRSFIFTGLSTSDPKPLYTMSTFVFQTGEDMISQQAKSNWKSSWGQFRSYVDIFQTGREHTAGYIQDASNYDTDSQEFVPSLMRAVNLDPEKIFGDSGEQEAYKTKSRDIGNLVTIVDQESKNLMPAPTKTVRNLVTTNNDGNTWVFHSVNDYESEMYNYESPDEAKHIDGVRYSSMAMHVRNVDMGAVAAYFETATDWAHMNFEQAASIYQGLDLLPKIIGISYMHWMTPVAGTAMGVGWAAVKWNLFREIYNPAISETAQKIREGSFGMVTSVSDALQDEKFCRTEKDRVIKEVEDQWGTTKKWLIAGMVIDGINTAVDITMVAAGVSSFGVSLAVAAAFSGGTYLLNKHGIQKHQKKMMDAISTGFATMKTCKETEFEVFAVQAIDTEDAIESQMENELEGIGGKAFADTAGQALDMISPDMKKSLLSEVSDKNAWNTMTLRSNLKESRINIRGSDVYQVHFDKDANWKWMIGENCPIQFCDYKTAPGGQEAYSCFRGDGYNLYGPDGSKILTSPLSLGWTWYNHEGYAAVPQRVINIDTTSKCVGAGSEKAILEVHPTHVNFLDENVGNELTKQMWPGEDYETVKDTVDVSLGGLEMVKTRNMMAYFAGDGTIVARSTTTTGECGFGTDRYYPDAHFLLKKNGNVEIVYNDGTPIEGGCNILSLRSPEDFISFTDGKIIKGSGEYNDYLHLFAYTMIDKISKEALTGMGVSLDNQNNPTFDFETSDAYDKTGALERQMNALLENMPMDVLQNEAGESLTFDDGKVSFKDADGNMNEYVIDPIASSTNEDGCLVLKNKKGGQVRLCPNVGPDGPELEWLDKNDNPVRAPFIIGWGVGQGGSMQNDGQSLSIKNEFPLAINPNFSMNGALAAGGYASPALPPWGGRSGAPDGAGAQAGGGERNPLAALPWMPEGWQGIMFLFIIMFAAAAVYVTKGEIIVEEEK